MKKTIIKAEIIIFGIITIILATTVSSYVFILPGAHEPWVTIENTTVTCYPASMTCGECCDAAYAYYPCGYIVDLVGCGCLNCEPPLDDTFVNQAQLLATQPNDTYPVKLYINTTNLDNYNLTVHIKFYVNEILTEDELTSIITSDYYNTLVKIAEFGEAQYSSIDNVTATYWVNDGYLNTTQTNITITVYPNTVILSGGGGSKTYYLLPEESKESEAVTALQISKDTLAKAAVIVAGGLSVAYALGWIGKAGSTLRLRKRKRK